MSNKYTPLNNAEDSSSIPETVLPSYELDDVTPGAPSGHDHVCSPPQPLNVKFHGDDSKVLKFELNYYPHRGIDGIHQIIRKKLHSLDIDLGDEQYLIVVKKGFKFRYISIDEDSVGKSIHYIKAGEELATERALKRKDLLFVAKFVFFFFAFILIYVLFIIYFIKTHGG